MKNFMRITKAKLIIFIILGMLFVYSLIKSDQIIGNFNFEFLIFGLVILYIFLSAIFFATTSKKNFVIGIIVIILMVVSLYLVNIVAENQIVKHQAAILAKCTTEIGQVNSDNISEWQACTKRNGLKNYR